MLRSQTYTQRMCARFGRDQRGVAAVEFAMLLPLMITLLIGGVEVSKLVSIDRKVSLTTRAVADLVAQWDVAIPTADMTNILNAAKAVMAPFPDATLKVTVSSVKIDLNKKATIAWSETCHGTAKVKDSTVTVPEALSTPDTSLIWAEVQYTYAPIFAGAPTDLFWKLTGPKTLQNHIYMRPRLQKTIDRAAGTATC